jgi:hypothetical protein
LNSGDVQGRLQNGQGRAAKFTREMERPDAAKVRELYLAAFAREPRPEESEFILSRVADYQNKQQAWEDVIWAILNAREFQFVK